MTSAVATTKRIELSHVIYEKAGMVSTITLNRPEKLNAISHGPGSVDAGMVEGIRLANADDEVGCIILTGAGRAFSAGGDMSQGGAPRETALDWYHFLEDIDRDLRVIRDSEKPIIGAINGLCYGDGLIVASHTDMLVASEAARFGLIESRFGATGVEMFPFLIGPQWSKFLMLTGELISARKAKEIGLVIEVVPVERFREKAYDLARRVASLPRQGVAMNKRTINQAMDIMGFEAQKRAARGSNAVANAVSHLARLPDGRSLFEILRTEGFRAFIEARDAAFRTPWLEEDTSQRRE